MATTYLELNPTDEKRIQFLFTGKREHLVKVNVLNAAHHNRHFGVKIPSGPHKHAIVPDSLRLRFNFDLESTDKTRSTVNNIGRAIVQKKTLLFGSHEIQSINNADIVNTYNNLYLDKNDRENCILQGIQTEHRVKIASGS